MEQEYKPKPINKEYLASTLKDFDSNVLEKKYIQSDDEQLHAHSNKEVLDRLSTSDNGTLLFGGNEISSSVPATDGKSAYEIAVDNGFTGTEQEWLDSLKGEDGKQIDAYTKEEADEKFITAPQIWTGTNQFKLGVDENGNYGYYKDGADTVTPFLSEGEINCIYTTCVTFGRNETDQIFNLRFSDPNIIDSTIHFILVGCAYSSYGQTSVVKINNSNFSDRNIMLQYTAFNTNNSIVPMSKILVPDARYDNMPDLYYNTMVASSSDIINILYDGGWQITTGEYLYLYVFSEHPLLFDE